MMPKFKGKTKPKLHKPSMETVMRWMVTLLLGFVVLLPVFAGVTQYEQNRAKADVEDVLAFMQTSCRKYDNYRLANTTEALQDILTKVKTLTAYRYEEEDALLNENRLQSYAKFQYLTGIFVLDENFSVLAHYDKAGKDESLLLSQITGDKNATDILNYPQKTYADQICLNDNTYNYAISARQDKPGLVICYTDITRFQNDKNELSLSNMLDAEMFRQDVTVVITDGMRVISTNCEQLENTLVQYYPIADVLVGGEQLTPDTLLQLKNDSGTWYGMFTQYRDYYLYAFFPSRVVYASRRGWMLLFTAIYLFCGMGYLIWRQYSKKRRLLRMEKEYHLVSAISSIYLSNLLIHPQDDTWEPVVQSERMKAITNGVLSAKAMLEKFNTECVAEAYREEFRAFTDLDTAQQRLEGKAFDGFTMENVEGKWYQLLLVPQRRFTHREKPSSLMLLFRDVSEQKERDMEYQENLRRAAEEATLANAAKTDFLRRMSHDIRTPINGIRGMVQIADRFPNDAKKQAECRAKIMRSSDFLLELVNDVLDMSKLESGEMQLEEVPFNLNELLHDVGTLLSTQAQARGITYTITMEDKREKHVIGSPLHLRQIFQNIGGNAIKYGRAGGYVHATCSIVSQTENTVRYRFICEDNGCGMSEEYQKHMFEPFSQENSGARTTYQGTGLGLSIVKKLVDAMVQVRHHEIDLRISSMPTIYGEKIVLRLLDKSGHTITKQSIGLEGTDLQKYDALLKNSSGVILIVGPTGSGKSTTMCAMLQELANEETNLMTLEDPVEYNIPGVNQCQINEKTGMTFAAGLRAILRQDPDVISVGEIRDGETGAIAIRAAITGHLVLSTLHTNDAVSAIDRLVDIGVEPYLISSALRGVISQRLVRKVCPHCKKAYRPEAEELAMLGLPEDANVQFYRGEGCQECYHTGYKGRRAVFEIFMLNGRIRRMVTEGAKYDALLRAATETNFVTMRENCRNLVLRGEISAAEAARAINSTAD